MKSKRPVAGKTRRAVSAAFRVALLAAALVALGCGAVPPVHYYTLDTPQQRLGEERSRDRNGKAVGIRDFTVDPPYDRDTLVYRIGDRPTEVGFYDYHRWAAPLGRMLPVAVAAGLDGVAGSSRVETDEGLRSYDLLLFGRVLSIEEVDYPDRQEVRLYIELALRRPDGTELWSRVAGGRSSLDTEEVADVVEALGELLTRVVQELRTEFAAVLAEEQERGAAAHSR